MGQDDKGVTKIPFCAVPLCGVLLEKGSAPHTRIAASFFGKALLCLTDWIRKMGVRPRPALVHPVRFYHAEGRLLRQERILYYGNQE